MVRARLLLVCAGTLAGLLLAELAVRLLDLAPPAPRRVLHAGQSRDWCCGPELFLAGVHRFAPGSSFSHCYSGPARGDFDAEGCVSYRINGQGYRGPEFTVQKPPDAYRIVILGDSFSFGEGTPEPLIYPALLVEALRARRAGGRRIEVVNLGVPGDDVEGALVTQRNFARRLAPDFIVLQWNTNDFPSPDVQRDHLRLIGTQYRELFANAERLRFSRLLGLVYVRLRLWQLSRELITTTSAEVATRADGFAAIGRLRRLVEQDGAGFAVLAFPELVRFDAYPYAAIVEALRAYCQTEQIPLIDLLPALSAHRDRELWVHETDHHPNRIAHAIAARELAQGLEALLPAE